MCEGRGGSAKCWVRSRGALGIDEVETKASEGFTPTCLSRESGLLIHIQRSQSEPLTSALARTQSKVHEGALLGVAETRETLVRNFEKAPHSTTTLSVHASPSRSFFSFSPPWNTTFDPDK